MVASSSVVAAWIVAYSRIVVSRPMRTWVGSPRNFRSCGMLPTTAPWWIWQPGPIVVHPSMTAWRPTRVPAPSTTRGPTYANGPITTPGSSSAPRATTAVGWIDGFARSADSGSGTTAPATRAQVPVSRSASGIALDNAGKELCFRDEVSMDVGLSLHLADPLLEPKQGQLETELVSRPHRLAKLRVVDPHEVDELLTRTLHRVQQKDAAALRHRLDDQDRGHDRMPGKMAREERLVDRHVLDPDDAVLLQAQDAVDQEERVPVGHDLLDRLDVELDRPHVAVPRHAVRDAAEQGAGLLVRGQALHEADVGRVPRLDRQEVSARGAAEKEEVAQEVEDLVAYELVVEAERLPVQDAVRLHHDGVLERAPLDHPALAEALHVALQDEGARGGDLLHEGLRRDVVGGVLGAPKGVLVFDGERDAQSVVRERDEDDAAFLEPHGLPDAEIPARGVLLGDSRALEERDVRPGAPVLRLGRLLRIERDDHVVDLEAGDRRQDVLDGVHFGVAVLQDRPAHVVGVGARVARRDGN